MTDMNKIGPYELRGELGRGAMARVWRAWDPNLQREVAIKEPLFDPSLPPDVLDEMGRRFVAEGRAAARLSHPNIVAIYAADVWDGRPAIVMELVEGATLSDILRRGPLTPTDALSVLDQLLDAAGYAHARGVVHRDIKPDNVFVGTDGRVRLADFGVARVDNGATRATMAGAVLGTPGYMSPEQARGDVVDSRSDIFSIGVVAHEMLSGSNPFGSGETTAMLYRIVHEPPAELPPSASEGLPADLRPAIMAALAKDPATRPQTAADFKAMLQLVWRAFREPVCSFLICCKADCHAAISTVSVLVFGLVCGSFATCYGTWALDHYIKICRGYLDRVLAHSCGLARTVCSRRGCDAVVVKVDDDLVSCLAPCKC